MPRNPGATLPSTQRRATGAADIGHVAPDFSADSPQVVNTLVIRPQFRLSLRLGSIEDLFPTQPNTPAGRMARMQVLGLFYNQLGHAKAAAAFPITWQWFQDKIVTPHGNDPDATIQDWLKTRVVDG